MLLILCLISHYPGYPQTLDIHITIGINGPQASIDHGHPHTTDTNGPQISIDLGHPQAIDIYGPQASTGHRHP